MSSSQKQEKTPILREKAPVINYTKRYDQVSWHSADTDFEVDPSASSADEHNKIQIKNGKTSNLCTRRNRKLTALVVVVFVFLIIMAGLIYLYYSKSIKVTIISTESIKTDCGEVTGIVESGTKDGKQVETHAFKGIPYANPPVDHLRWSAPIALSADKSKCWKGVFKATKYGSECVQKGEKSQEGSEDCLYLNVYTPTLHNTSKLPVFVWIHGGYLMNANGSQYGYGPDSEFALSMNVVAVSMNYRLNAFGFLTLEELWQSGKSYGNYGLMDQILALKWVQNNIKNFGGDPNSVTICGQSSGGTSIFGLLVSPMADGLFHKAIPLSGSPRFEKSYKDAARENRIFIKQTRCQNYNSSNDIKNCLYNLTALEITSAVPYNTYPNWAMRDLLDFPTKGLFDGALAVIEPIVVPRPPKQLYLLSHDIRKKVSVLIGSTAQEIGIFPVNNFVGNDTWNLYYCYLKKRLNKFNPTFIDIVLGKLYNNKTSNSTEHSTEYMHEVISSDVRVTCPTNQLTKDFAKSRKHSIFRYVVSHRPNKPLPVFGYPATYSFHMWDTITLFNFEMVKKFNYLPNESDLQFKQSLRETFKHFMLYGHPEQTDWGKGKTGVFNKDGFMHILEGDYHEKECRFWSNTTNGFVPYAWIN